MKKLNKPFAKIFTVAILLGTTLTSYATNASLHNEQRSLPKLVEYDLSKNVRQLISLGDRYARLGQAVLALEHYSRSIRIGRLADPDYQNLETQNKIVALIKQQQQEKTELAVKQLIWQGDDAVAAHPEKALEYYSKSIRVGKLYDSQYLDAPTQQKIVKLVNVLGSTR